MKYTNIGPFFTACVVFFLVIVSSISNPLFSQESKLKTAFQAALDGQAEHSTPINKNLRLWEAVEKEAVKEGDERALYTAIRQQAYFHARSDEPGGIDRALEKYHKLKEFDDLRDMDFRNMQVVLRRNPGRIDLYDSLVELFMDVPGLDPHYELVHTRVRILLWHTLKKGKHDDILLNEIENEIVELRETINKIGKAALKDNDQERLAEALKLIEVLGLGEWMFKTGVRDISDQPVALSTLSHSERFKISMDNMVILSLGDPDTERALIDRISRSLKRNYTIKPATKE